MPRYIDADKLIELATHEGAYGYVDVHDICNVPTANVVERKKGKWEGKKVFIRQWQSARCSACGKYHVTPFSYYFFDYKYCPYCGADMRGENR